MAINETISTGNKYRRLKDATNKVWQRLSFWTKASDVEFDNGSTAEEALGSITGITDSVNSTSSNVAASAKAVSTLNTTLASFQTGVDKLYDKLVSLGVTPTGKTFSELSTALQTGVSDNFTITLNGTTTGGSFSAVLNVIPNTKTVTIASTTGSYSRSGSARAADCYNCLTGASDSRYADWSCSGTISITSAEVLDTYVA